MKRSKAFISFLLSLILILTALTVPAYTALAAKPLTLSKTSVTLEAGNQFSLKATAANGTEINRSVRWYSSDARVASVDNTGVISALGAGATSINAVYSGKTYSCKVNVKQASPIKKTTYKTRKKCSLFASKNTNSAERLKIPKGKKIKLISVSKDKKWYKVKYIGAKKKSDKKKGFVLAKNVKAKTTVTNGKTKSIAVINPPKCICQGEKIALVAHLNPINSSKPITWSSSNTKIVKIDKNGVISYVSDGSVTIKASSGGKNFSFILESFKGVKAKYATVPMSVGESFDIKRNLKLSTTFENSAKTYTSSNPSVCEIKDGKIVAKALGTSSVKVTVNGVTQSFNVNVHPVSQNASSIINTIHYTDTEIPSDAYPEVYIPIEEYLNDKGRTDDGSTHPDCLYFRDGFNGYKYWLSYSPYPYFDDFYENPCILASNDLENWEIPSGGSNPIEPPPLQHRDGWNYNSDPELVYNTDTKELECWFRVYDYFNNQVTLFRKCTKDGINWSDKEKLDSCLLSKRDDLSPSVLYENGVYKMWSVDHKDAYKIMYREYNSKTKTWSERRTLNIEFTLADCKPWHLNVCHTPKGYEMVISASNPNPVDFQKMSLYYTCSSNNVNYELADVMLAPSGIEGSFDCEGIYRSALLYAEGSYYLFYPGVKNRSFGHSGLGLISGDSPFTLK